jgi:thiamine-monophosphate kinase
VFTEQQLIHEIRRRFGDVSVAVGIGDDAAVVNLPPGSSAVLCADMLVEGTHFEPSKHPAHALGFKAIAINVSDVGAMGGVPAFALLSLAVPGNLDAHWIQDFLDGVGVACSEFEVVLVGGDSSLASSIFIDVSIVGHVLPGNSVGRGGAQPGDGIFVTGMLGGSANGLRRLQEGIPPADEAVRRHLYPVPRHRVGCALASRATAMIDVSDGFSIDLGHILDASGVCARVDAEKIPRAKGTTMEMALHGGEDYELIVTGRSLPDVVENVPLTWVGEIVESQGIQEAYLISQSGDQVLVRRGWQHF